LIKVSSKRNDDNDEENKSLKSKIAFGSVNKLFQMPWQIRHQGLGLGQLDVSKTKLQPPILQDTACGFDLIFIREHLYRSNRGAWV